MANGDDYAIQNIRSAREMVLRYFDTLATTKPHETNYTIGTTALALGSTAFRRLGYLLSNTGSVNIAIGWSLAVTITTGILLEQGGSFQTSWFFDLELVDRPIYAIAASGGATLFMVENAITGA